MKYNADMYLRLSVEDGDKIESDSIVNQRMFIQEFLKSAPDIQLHEEKIDDGYSGADFNRPALLSMFEDMKAGVINCIIVKDLSRFGRDYIQCGKYIRKIFPQLGIRFISINDYYDSSIHDPNDLLLSMKVLFDDAYIVDTSIKVRDLLESKRKRGEYVGSFVVYGYLKGEKNKIFVDTYAAEVIRDIFDWKLAGFNNEGIANKLNNLGILSPMEYKNWIGVKFYSSFKRNPIAKWSSKSVERILNNEIYIGNLVQGKRTTPNHRVKRIILKPEEEWTKVENTHEPIVSKDVFDRVQELMQRDTRSSSVDKEVYLFSGIVFCGDCKESLIRKETQGKSGKKYVYYVCSTNKRTKQCSPHSFSEKKLCDIVFQVIQNQIKIFFEMESSLKTIDLKEKNGKTLLKIAERIQVLEEEYHRNIKFKLSAYADKEKKIITEEECQNFTSVYVNRCEEIKNALWEQRKLFQTIQQNKITKYTCYKEFFGQEALFQLDRKILLMFIKRIYIFNKNFIGIKLNYQDEFKIC